MLRVLVGLLLALFVMMILMGCGGSSSPKVTLTIQGQNEKIVTISSGETALDAVKKAYSYSKDPAGTTINGVKNYWTYTVDGVEPTTYIGDYKITKDCAIDLQVLVVK